MAFNTNTARHYSRPHGMINERSGVKSERRLNILENHLKKIIYREKWNKTWIRMLIDFIARSIFNLLSIF